MKYGENAPFRVFLDSAHVQDVGYNFKIEIIDREKFKLIVEEESQPIWFRENADKQSVHATTELPKEYGQGTELVFNTWVEGPSFRFQLRPNRVYATDDINSIFQLHFSESTQEAEDILERLSFEPTAEGASAVSVRWQHQDKEKVRALLDAFAEAYIQGGLAQKQMAAKNSIEFIEKELKRVADSLEIVEEYSRDSGPVRRPLTYPLKESAS